MALAADKAHTRAIVAAAEVAVPPAELLTPATPPTLEPPVVVKPVDGDNSLGVTLVHDQSEYATALDQAFTCSSRVLVETYIEAGREVRCGVLEQDGELICLPLEEYALNQPIRSHADKLRRNEAGELIFSAKTADRSWIVEEADPVTAPVWEAARRSHRALGCRHYSLFDFRIDPDGRPWFLEAGLYCSFAPQSVIPAMAAAAGTALPELFATMLRQIG
nr:hypothetical protein [Kineosporia babensis]